MLFNTIKGVQFLEEMMDKTLIPAFSKLIVLHTNIVVWTYSVERNYNTFHVIV